MGNIAARDVPAIGEARDLAIACLLGLPQQPWSTDESACAIVEAIMEARGWRVAYHYEESLGEWWCRVHPWKGHSGINQRPGPTRCAAITEAVYVALTLDGTPDAWMVGRGNRPEPTHA